MGGGYSKISNSLVLGNWLSPGTVLPCGIRHSKLLFHFLNLHLDLLFIRADRLINMSISFVAYLQDHPAC